MPRQHEAHLEELRNALYQFSTDLLTYKTYFSRTVWKEILQMILGMTTSLHRRQESFIISMYEYIVFRYRSTSTIR